MVYLLADIITTHPSSDRVRWATYNSWSRSAR